MVKIEIHKNRNRTVDESRALALWRKGVSRTGELGMRNPRWKNIAASPQGEAVNSLRRATSAQGHHCGGPPGAFVFIERTRTLLD